MTSDAFKSSRLVFYPKADGPFVDKRHGFTTKKNLVFKYSKTDLVDEGMLLEPFVVDQVLRHGLPAVPLLGRWTNRQTYQVMRMARGKPLAELPIEEQRSAWLEVARTLRSLHEIKGVGAGLLVNAEPLTGAYESWTNFIYDKLLEHVNSLLAWELLDETEFLQILEHFAAYDPPDNQNSLLHGDPSDNNIFGSEGHLTDIIDWEDALIGDPVFELANWATFHAPEEQERFLDAYFIQPRPADFKPRFWTYFLRIAISKLVVLHRAGFKDLTRGKQRVTTALTNLL